MSTEATDAPDSGAVPGPLFRIGIDGGGSGTRARLVDAAGNVLAEGRSGPSGLTQGVNQAWRNIEKAIAQAVQNSALHPSTVLPANTALGLGLAGANSALLHAQFLQANPGYAVLCLQTDADTTLLGAHGTAPGAVVAVGTGSVGLARSANGHIRRVGGWGFPSGDDGSGALLGLHAVNLTQRVLDGMQPSGPMAEAVLQTCGGSPEALLEWCCAAGQNRFASLAPLVFDSAEHDPAATALLSEAAHCVERMALALDPTHALPLALLGSVGRRLATRLSAALQERMVLPKGDAMDGALLLTASLNPAHTP